MSLPDQIEILGRTYKIVLEDSSDHGGCTYDEGVIDIDPHSEPQTQRETLVHEVVHGILHESGLRYILKPPLEEAVCRAIEHGMIRSGLIREF